MEPLTPTEIAQAVEGRWIFPESQPDFGSSFLAQVIRGVSTDTRTLEPGDLFIPLQGEHFDGHDHLEAAWRGGAAAVMSARDLPAESGPGPVLRVENTLRAYQDLARYYLDTLQVEVVAVTGSNGKTSTKELVACLLGAVAPVHKSGKNYNNEVGVPKTLLELNVRHRLAVLELAMRAPGEIAQLARVCRPRVGVVTLIGEVHLEFLKTRQAIAEAKAELLAALPATGTAIINGDDPWCSFLSNRTPARVVSFGRGPQADVRLIAAHSRGWEGYQAQIHTPRGALALDTPLLGPANLYNLLAAVAVAEVWEVPFGAMAAALAGFRPSAERLGSFVTPEGIRVLDDTYNSNPTAASLALETLAGLPASGRRVAVLGEMKELGTEEVEMHRRVGRRAKECGVDLLLTLGPLGREMAVGAREAGFAGDLLECDSREAAISVLRQRLAAGDVVLLKGSRAWKMEEIAAALGAGKQGGGGSP